MRCVDDHHISNIKYGTFEMAPVVFNDNEAWWFLDGAWKTMNAVEVLFNANVMTEAAWKADYGELLEMLPAEAFKS